MQKSIKDKRLLSGTITVILIYGIVYSLLSIVFMLLFAALISKEVIPEAAFGFVGVFCIFLSSLITGYLSVKSLGRALLTALLQAVFNFIFSYLMGMLIFVRIIPQDINLYYFIACMAGAVFGGILAAAIKPRRRKIKY